MSPTGPLSADQIAIVKSWIDQGAEWPDDLSGERPALPIDQEALRLLMVIRDGDREAANTSISTNPKIARLRGAGGSTPLMMAALYGDVVLMKRLLAAGGDPNAANAAGATALMWALPDVDKMRLLLDAGADVNAHSDENRSALVVAAGIQGAAPAVRLLLEYGAAAWASPTGGDPGPLREAARVGSPQVFAMLVEYGADVKTVPEVFLRTNCFECARLAGVSGSGPLSRVPPPDRGLRPSFPDSSRTVQARMIGAASSTPGAVRAAVERSLPLLQRIDLPFIRKTGCVSCHHNSLISIVVDAARRSGYRVDEDLAAEQRRTIATYLETWRERTLQNIPIAGGTDTIGYLMLGMAAAGQSPDAATDAQAIWLKRRQMPDGHWPVLTIRPPIESNGIEVTAVAMRALQIYAPKTERAQYVQAVERARNWLTSAKAETTEERAFRMLGLLWADAANGLVAEAGKDLLALQQSDGGWGQLPSMSSDAYATGEALFALQATGVGSSHAGFRRGVEFLLRTQLEDGSWFVKSRAEPIQAYFESGFPHRADQWISAAGTAWATAALAAAR